MKHRRLYKHIYRAVEALVVVLLIAALAFAFSL
jgi:hypothetical protein